MRTTTKLWILTGVLLMARTSFAQPERESVTGFYRLDFVTKEVDDNKVINSRTYSLIVSDKSQGTRCEPVPACRFLPAAGISFSTSIWASTSTATTSGKFSAN